MGPRSGKLLTGAVPGKPPTVPRPYLNNLRAGIHNLRTGRVRPQEVSEYITALEGRIAYAKCINFGQGNAFSLNLDDLLASLNVRAELS